MSKDDVIDLSLRLYGADFRRDSIPIPPIDANSLLGRKTFGVGRMVAICVSVAVTAGIALTAWIFTTANSGGRQAESAIGRNLTAADFSLATRIANDEALRLSDASRGFANDAAGRTWPKSLVSASALVASQPQMAQYIDTQSIHQGTVLIVRLIGAFNVATGGGPGDDSSSGNVVNTVTIAVNRHTAKVIHLSVSRADAPVPVTSPPNVYAP